MIEIGPNLKEALLDYMHKNLQLGKPPGHLLKSNFGDILETEIVKIYGNAVQNCSKKQEYPVKSGYYWFVNNYDKKIIVYYCAEYDYFTFHGDNIQYKPQIMKLMHGYFLEPIKPITS